jgi:uncharacterized protein YciU (UPF0263 family)
MRKFKVEYGYAFSGGIEEYDVIEMLAENKLDLLKKVRRRFRELCYDDRDLVEWIESGDNWDREVDDEFLLGLIDDDIYSSFGSFGLLLAEDIYFDCVELK